MSQLLVPPLRKKETTTTVVLQRGERSEARVVRVGLGVS